MYEFLYKKTWAPPGFMAKLLLIMRLTTLLLITAIMQVSAGSLAQKITLSEKNTPLISVFEKINNQTGYDFLVTKSMLKYAKPVNVNVKNADLKDVLKDIFKDQQLDFVIEEKTVVISIKQATSIDKIVSFFQRDSVIFKGKVLDAFGQPLPGASVKVKGTNKATFTTKEGNFAIFAASNAILQVSYVGYVSQELQMRREDAGVLVKFNMKPAAQDLGQVDIVSTGYQDLPKERATGSFQIITKEQLQHSNDPNLIKRLEGITTGLDFNNPKVPNLSTNTSRPSPTTALTIRGKNTFNSLSDRSNTSGQPLIVVDGIAIADYVDKIDPNDVESINILQDAAAASIWGARAANGVIVIKTKRARYNKPVSLSFNSNVNVSDKIDLFYNKYMSTSDFIDAQTLQYYAKYPISDTSAYVRDPAVNQALSPISPVAEILNNLKRGKILQDQATAQLNALRGNDVRRDFTKYLLRKQLNQNYSLSIDGGSGAYAYRLSGGYAKTQNNSVASGSDRYNVSYNMSVKPVKNLEVVALLGFSQNKTTNQGNTRISGVNPGYPYYPYTKLADDQGNHLPITYNYRPSFLALLAKTYGTKILDMTYTPLDDINEGYNKSRLQNFNLNLNATYTFSPVFSGNITYGYNGSFNQSANYQSVNSYYMRELINIFTDRASPNTRAIPLGGFYAPQITNANSQTLRTQLNANKTWNGKHVLSAIIGADASQSYSLSRSQQFYGYDPNTLASNVNLQYGVNKTTLFNDPIVGLSTKQISYTNNGFSDARNRLASIFSNAAYTYDKRYTLSASYRNDASSDFGKGTNNSGAGYFSVGTSWNISNERFYKLDWLPYLQLKATFGYNGNANPAAVSIPRIAYNGTGGFGTNLLPYASTGDGANPDLRPEKAGMLNIGLDFGLKNSRLSGSIQYYVRNTKDLVTSSGIDPSSGFNSLSYNSANLRGTGVDIILNSLNLKTGLFSWNSNFLFSSNKVKITRLLSTSVITATNLASGLSLAEGYGLTSLFAYKWAGLDPATGDPMGYLDGKAVRISSDLLANLLAIQNQGASSLHYYGSSVPVYFGSFRNTFNYGALSVSANVLYKLGYYFRRPVAGLVQYYALFNTALLQGADYANRWQKPGDEKITNVPSQIFPITENTRFRDDFYQNSDINVLKGDHIRLQEIQLAYSFRKTNWVIKNPRIYANVTNLGILWKANKAGLDPDINDFPIPKTYSIGLSASF